MRRKLTYTALFGITAAVTSLAATFIGVPASAAGTAPPNKITVDVVTVNGSGCPAGTAEVIVDADNTGFTVNYDFYLALVGGAAKPTDLRKNCQLSLVVHVPQGFTYAIAEADFNGFLHLASGATALQRASYYFQGDPDTLRLSHAFTGPFHGNWQTSDVTDVATLVWARCGEQLGFNVNTELRVKANPASPTTTSFMSMDTTSGSVNNIFHIAWKRC